MPQICDFCRNEISALKNEITAVISYLPCFHAICQNCKKSSFSLPSTITCAICNYHSSHHDIFDLELPDQNKILCRSCIGINKKNIEFCCQTCNNAFFCSNCIIQHKITNHNVIQAKRGFIPRSQCSIHESQAVALCSCNMRLCEECYCNYDLKHSGHTCSIFVNLAESGINKLRNFVAIAKQDSLKLQKAIQFCYQQKVNINRSAKKARASVANEIVELCNAIIRRGNDIVTAIDIAEDSKLKLVTKFENEVKFTLEKMQKIEYFSDMACTSMTADFPAIMCASNFTESAYNFVNEKQKYLQFSFDALQKPTSLKYLSDSMPVLDSISGFGKIEFDGVVCTPKSSTPKAASLFSVSSNGVLNFSGLPVQYSVNNNNTQTNTSSASTSNISNPLQYPPQSPYAKLPTGGVIGNRQPNMLNINALPPPPPIPNQFMVGNPFFGFSSQFFQQQQARNIMAMQRAVAQQHQKNCLTNPQIPNLASTNKQLNQVQFAANANAQAAQHQRQLIAPVASGSVNPHLQIEQHQNCLNLGAFPCFKNPTVNFLNLQKQPVNQIERRKNSLDNGLSYLSPNLQINNQNLNSFCDSIISAQLLPSQNCKEMTKTKVFDQKEQEVQEVVEKQQNMINNNNSLPPSITPDSTVQISPIKNSIIQQQLTEINSESSSKNNNSDNLLKKRLNTNDETTEPPPKYVCLENMNENLKSSNNNDCNNVENETFNQPEILNFETNSSSLIITSIVENQETTTNDSDSFYSSTTNNINLPNNAPKCILIKKNNTHETEICDVDNVNDIKPEVIKDQSSTVKINDLVCGKENQNSLNISKESSSVNDNSVNQNQVSTTSISVPTSDSSNKINSEITNILEEDREIDMWDDYCYVCNQGCDDTTGDLGCCATCPHVFHNTCHIPEISEQMSELPDDWKCSFCIPCERLTKPTNKFSQNEKLLCAKVILSCFKVKIDIEPFFHEVPRNVTLYYEIIKNPISMDIIAKKLTLNQYESVEKFIADMNLLFKNCSKFNSPSGLIAKSGRAVYALFLDAVRKYLPYYVSNVWIYVSLRNDDDNFTGQTRRCVTIKKSK